jgi:hypothetical protein
MTILALDKITGNSLSYTAVEFDSTREYTSVYLCVTDVPTDLVTITEQFSSITGLLRTCPIPQTALLSVSPST